MELQRGVLYTAHGDIWASRARESIKSLLKHMPDMPVIVFSDKDFSDLNVAIGKFPKDIEPRALKMHALLSSPYRETLYLDADTYICSDFSDVFNLLTVFDLAISPCIQKEPSQKFENIPESFPEMNSGVILYKKSERVQNFLTLFQKTYQEMKGIHNNFDEPSLRYSIWHSGLRLAPLPIEYNFRVDNPIATAGEVKILHGKNVSETLAQEINKKYGYRVYIPSEGINNLER